MCGNGLCYFDIHASFIKLVIEAIPTKATMQSSLKYSHSLF